MKRHFDINESNDLRQIAGDIIHRLSIHRKKFHLQALKIQIERALEELEARQRKYGEASKLKARRTLEEREWMEKGKPCYLRK